MFQANARRIQDIDYPVTKIVGTWVHVAIVPVRTDYEEIESKIYFEFQPGGKGLTRQATRNKMNGGHLSAEAAFGWKYLGKNHWQITTPGSSAYRVTDSHLLKRDTSFNRPPRSFVVRYYEDGLYDFETRRVFVRATASNVSALANRMRGHQPVFHLDLNKKWR